MLFGKAAERRRRETRAEGRRLTTAVANAIAITLDKNARASYERQSRTEDHAAGQSVQEFSATVARLAALAPGAVKVH